MAAAPSPSGASNALLFLLPDSRFEPAVSVPVFADFRSVQLHPENLLQRGPERVEAFLDNFLGAAHLQEVFFLWRPGLRDSGGDRRASKVTVTRELRILTFVASKQVLPVGFQYCA